MQQTNFVETTLKVEENLVGKLKKAIKVEFDGIQSISITESNITIALLVHGDVTMHTLPLSALRSI